MRPTTTRGCGAPAAPAKTATASGRQPASARRRKNAGRAFMNVRILSRSSGTRAPGARILAARPVAKDSLLIAVDRAVFRSDPTVWLQSFIHPFLTDVFFVFYLAYYFIAIALGVVFWVRDRAVARRFIFTLSLAYVL